MKWMDTMCIPARRNFAALTEGGELSWGDRLLARCHYTICPPCRRYRRSLEATADALKALRDRDGSG